MDWIQSHIPPWVFIAIIAHLGILGTVAYLILLERKVASWAQDRLGPNRVGLGGLVPLVLLPLATIMNVDKIGDRLRRMHMFGLGQPLADGLKFILKEDYRPKGVDVVLFTVAPMVMIAVVIISIAVLPWGGVHQATHTIDTHGLAPLVAAQQFAPGNAWDVTVLSSAGEQATITYKYPFQITSLNIGVLYVLATLSLAVYGVVVGGWASNNKYSFLGGLRATANMISYEIPLGLAVLSIVVLFGTLRLDDLTALQAHYWAGFIPAWNVFAHPLAFCMFLICIHAEANRAPFDLAEAEQELVGGYHTEYSAMRFALFFLAEYAGMITTSAVCVALFFGGWHIPWVDLIWPNVFGNPHNHPEVVTNLGICILRALVFFGKTIFIIFVFMWVRWSLPRFRFDQLMQLAWRGLIPVSLALLVASTLVVYAVGPERGDDMRVNGWMAIWLLVANVVVTAVTLVIGRALPSPASVVNKRLPVKGSRFNATPLPAGVQ